MIAPTNCGICFTKMEKMRLWKCAGGDLEGGFILRIPAIIEMPMMTGKVMLLESHDIKFIRDMKCQHLFCEPCVNKLRQQNNNRARRADYVKCPLCREAWGDFLAEADFLDTEADRIKEYDDEREGLGAWGDQEESEGED